MNNSKKLVILSQLLLFLTSLASCHDGESYAEMLTDERRACNSYLAQFKVENEIPADTIFETGTDAPFYRIDPDGNVYMQVLRASDRVADKPKDGENIYFRYTRYDIIYWKEYGTWTGEGNEADMSAPTTYFSYNNYTLASSAQYGFGVQMPLELVGVNCEVNLLIKSKYGVTNEIANVHPYLYHLRYFRGKV